MSGIDTSEAEYDKYDMFSPCPGCDNIGFSVQVFESTENGEVQLMKCSEPNANCRVSEYYPRHTGEDT